MLNKNEYQIKTIVDSLAVRDTNAHVSSTYNISGFDRKSLYVTNGLNQNAAIQIQGCYKDSATTGDWVNIGTAQTVNAGANAIIGTKEVDTLANYFSFIRATVTCSSGPASGNITVLLMLG